MEAKLAVLESKVEKLESWAEKHEREDERTHKNITHMMENMLAQMSGIERSAVRFETDLSHRNGQQMETQVSLKEIGNRVRVLERLAYIALGGLLGVGGLASFFAVRLTSDGDPRHHRGEAGLARGAERRGCGRRRREGGREAARTREAARP